MYGINELRGILGLSEYQVRRRIDAASSILVSHLQRGENNRLLVDSEGLELLKRLVNYEKSGKSYREAVEQVSDEIQSERDKKVGTSTPQTALIEQLLARIEDKDREVERLQEEVGWLRNEVERLQDMLNRQLPGKVSPWWRRLFRG